MEKGLPSGSPFSIVDDTAIKPQSVRFNVLN